MKEQAREAHVMPAWFGTKCQASSLTGDPKVSGPTVVPLAEWAVRGQEAPVRLHPGDEKSLWGKEETAVGSGQSMKATAWIRSTRLGQTALGNLGP